MRRRVARTRSGHWAPERRRIAALGVALALLAACGSRASHAQIVEALGAGGGGTGTRGAAAVGTGTAAGNGATGGGAGGGEAGPTGAGGAATANPADAVNAALPAGGNGGATDVGVTGDSITTASISILTGPVPGLFAGAPNGVDAFYAYQNSLGGVYGRQLKQVAQDDGFDCGINHAVAEEDVGKYFAFVGSFSLFDNCSGEIIKAHPDVPDVHVGLTTLAQGLPNNFSPQPVGAGASTGPFQYIKDKYPNAIGSGASLIGDVEAAKTAWENAKYVMNSLGYKFNYERVFEPTDTRFDADIIAMKNHVPPITLLTLSSADVKTMGRVLAQANGQWKPDVTLLGAAGYDYTLFTIAASNEAVEGAWLYLPTALYLGEDRADVPEVDLFLTWLDRTHPGANVDLFTVYGWVSARLFVQALQAAGPQATRAGELTALSHIDSFDSNGLLAPGGPASKRPPTCYVMVQVHDGKFQRVDTPPGQYRCDGTYVYREGG